MRYVKFFIGLMGFASLLSCSDNIDTPDQPGIGDIKYDATLSLAVNKPITTFGLRSTGETLVNHYNFVQRLTAVVEHEGLIVSVGDSINSTGVYGIEKLPIPSGAINVWMFANLEPSTVTELKKLIKSAFADQTLTLENETNGNLKMSNLSTLIEYTARPGQNYIGKTDLSAATEEIGDTIKLHRYISRIQLSQIALKLSDNFAQNYNDASFTLDTMFFSNVKSQYNLKGSEVTDRTSLWWDGAFEAIIPMKYKTIAGANKPSLRYNFASNPSDMSLYSFDNSFFYGTGFTPDTHISLDKNNTSYSRSDSKPIGSYCYVYENSNAEKNPTVLVVQGDLTLKTAQGTSIVHKDCFYTVPVNETHTSVSGGADHQYIKRNYIYDIKLTIAGPGSKDPYDVTPTAAINAQVTVKNWDVVNQAEDVD